MAITQEMKQELQRIKEDELKNQLLKERADARQKQDEQARIVEKEEAAMARERNKKDWDGKPFFGAPDPEHHKEAGKIETKADHLISKEFSGYNDWSVAMQGLLSASLELNKALYYDPLISFRDIPGVEKVGDLMSHLWDTGVAKVENAIERRTISNDALPKMRFAGDVDEKGNLTVHVIKDDKVDPTLTHFFANGIRDWAKVQGYNPTQQANNQFILKDDSGAPMTTKKFKELNDNPDTSLERFLSNRLKLNISYSGPEAPSAEADSESSTPSP